MSDDQEIKEILGLYEDDEFRDKIATVDKQGKRIWIYPKKPKGTYYTYRKIVSYILLVILFILPWLRSNGRPLFLFNIPESKFILFGYFFPPHDFYLFVIAMLISLVGIALFTVVFGRVFCGWICPQTIFMEMVYRRIEYLIEGDANAQKKLKNAPWNFNKIWRKTIKQILFFGIAVAIANTFLAYIIGSDQVLAIMGDPIKSHLNGFFMMIGFSFIFYFVFSVMREQVCTTICPYGRLQSVLLDDHSLAVNYDFVRGEPRGRINKKQVATENLGDCIDCNLCVKVCPTGIDIRNGIQLECVNCTACMDACDEVMEKVKRPKGLIRIDSVEGIRTGSRKIVNKRSLAYTLILFVLLGLEGFLLMGRSELDTLLLRAPGTLYYEKTPGSYSNLYNYHLNNKSDRKMNISFEVSNYNAKVEWVGNKPVTVPFESVKGSLFITIDKDNIGGRKSKLKINVFADGELIDQTITNFNGPYK